MIDAFTTQPHYLDHLAPIVDAMDGVVWVESEQLEARAHSAGLNVRRGVPMRETERPLLIAGWPDAQRANAIRPLVLLEHGAGQTYSADEAHPWSEPPPNYAGGLGWDVRNLALVLSPGPHAARNWREVYPDLEVVELQGSPRLDRWVGAANDQVRWNVGHGLKRAVTAAFHWDCPVCPETRATWGEWLTDLKDVAKERSVVGTGHPRSWPTLSARYDYVGISNHPEFEGVIGRGGWLVVDNSSVAYEWAGLGLPVIMLDSATYRFGHDHGLRFWSHAPGLSLIAGTMPLREFINQAEEPENYDLARRYGREGCVEAYGLPMFDGKATTRAVTAIERRFG